jgi:hypothetical protein
LDALEKPAKIFVSERPYEKVNGTACFSPYLRVELANLTSKHVPNLKFLAKVDTGADISHVPSELAKQLEPLDKGKPVLVRLAETEIKRVATYMLTLSIAGDDGTRMYRPERGVCLCDSDCGLIGMDIMKHWTVTFDGVRQTFTITI